MAEKKAAVRKTTGPRAMTVVVPDDIAAEINAICAATGVKKTKVKELVAATAFKNVGGNVLSIFQEYIGKITTKG